MFWIKGAVALLNLFADVHSFYTCADIVAIITDAVCVLTVRTSVCINRDIFGAGRPIGFLDDPVLFSPHPQTCGSFSFHEPNFALLLTQTNRGHLC